MTGQDRNGAGCREVRPLLKQIDSLFDIVFDYDAERYLIFFNGGILQSVYWKDLNKKVLEQIRQTYWINLNGNPFQEIDEHNEKIEQSKEKNREDLTRELAKDMRKAVMREGY